MIVLGIMMMLYVILIQYHICDQFTLFYFILSIYFVGFYIFYVIKDSSKYKYLQIVALLLLIPLSLGINTYLNKDRLIADRGLERCIINQTPFMHSITEKSLCRVHNLTVQYRYNVRNLEGIQYLKNLTSLDISTAYEIENLELLKHVPYLRELSISYLDYQDGLKLKDIASLEKLRLISPDLEKGQYLDLPYLEELEIQNMKLDNLLCIKNLKNLESLIISSSTIKDLEGIEELKDLRKLEIHNTDIYNIDKLKEVKSLEKVNIYTSKVKDLDSLKNISNIKKLTIRDSDNM